MLLAQLKHKTNMQLTNKMYQAYRVILKPILSIKNVLAGIIFHDEICILQQIYYLILSA